MNRIRTSLFGNSPSIRRSGERSDLPAPHRFYQGYHAISAALIIEVQHLHCADITYNHDLSQCPAI
jgi:hypothetical protein